MKHYETFNQPIYVISDTHGNFEYLLLKLKEYTHINHCVLIISGDIGFGVMPLDEYLHICEELNNFCLERHIKLYMVRGNHDDPSYFTEEKINFCNVKTVPDYSVITVGDEHILCVGGGVSIDRKYRIARFEKRKQLFHDLISTDPMFCAIHELSEPLPSYWEDELPVYDEEKLKEINDMGINISYIVSHTSPKFCFKYNKDGIATWINNDPSLNEVLDIERDVMTNIYQFLKDNNHLVKTWVYGHFHAHNDEIIDNTRFVTLANADRVFDVFDLNRKDDAIID